MKITNHNKGARISDCQKHEDITVKTSEQLSTFSTLKKLPEKVIVLKDITKKYCFWR